MTIGSKTAGLQQRAILVAQELNLRWLPIGGEPRSDHTASSRNRASVADSNSRYLSIDSAS
jgi:hypothetical protein